jgi:hypothetical protein
MGSRHGTARGLTARSPFSYGFFMKRQDRLGNHQEAFGVQPLTLLKKSLVDAMQGENRFESGAYTAVREHFEPIFNAAARRQRLFQQPVR